MAMNMNNCSVNIIINNCVQTKTCTKCLEVKPPTEFHKHKLGRGGCDSVCKSCKQKYYKDNKERIAERTKKYEQNNRWKINERNNNNYYNNEQFRLKKLLHQRINNALKGKDKTARTQELLGCNIDEFKRWLETNFTNDMSWENRGIYWDIDRVIPCSAFDLSDYEEQKKCFHYSNCQPLEKIANIKKSNTRDPELEEAHAAKAQLFLNK